MKKTILATLIAATSFASFNAAAETRELSPEIQAGVANTLVERAVDNGADYANFDLETLEFSVNDEGTLVISVDDKDGNNVWTGREVNESNKAYIIEDLTDVVKATHEEARHERTVKRAERQENRGRVIAPIEDMPSIPYTREDAIEYVKNTDDLKNGANLDKAVMYRMNNENKYEFSGSEKLAAVNKITGKGFQVHYGLDGQSFLVDGEGNQYTPEQVKEMAIAARKQVQEEAQKRAEVPPVDGELPPVDDVAPLPEVGIDEERVKEAVQNLVESGKNLNESGQNLVEAGNNLNESGSNLVEAGKSAKAQGQAYAAQQQAQIDEIYAQGQQNTSDIATLFNEVDRLDSRIDQTQALNAATVNARPMVTNGDTAFGAGVGYAGSEAAISVGVAHSFVDTGWSASATLAASSDDVVIGAGTQYTF